MALDAVPDDRQFALAPLDEKVDHVRGSPGGHLIIEYGDYQCPYCGTVYRLTPGPRPKAAWTKRVLYSFRGGTDGADPDGVLISDAAVGTDQAKKYVLVVDAAGKAQYREVQLGSLHDNLRVVTSGLKAGERIVVSGTQRTRPNDTVRANMVKMTDAAKPAA